MKREWLKVLREKKKFTHEKVAGKADISRAFYTEIENGTKNPSAMVAQRIGEVMGFKWTLFFENKCSKKQQKIKSA